MILRILTTVWGLYATMVLSGCSIAMALSGNKQPNFDYIVVGAPRTQVEAEFGHPTATKELTYGKQEATYKYEMGNSPNTGRAWVYGYAWLTIIGILGEPIYSLIELNMGHDEETQIVYGSDNKTLEIHGYTPPPVSKVVIESEEAQEKYIERRRKTLSAPTDQSSPPPAQ
jgi:hypothetical protein